MHLDLVRCFSSGCPLPLLLGSLLLSETVRGSEPVIPSPAPRVATGAWAERLREHPRLYGSKEYLRELAKAKPKAMAEIRTESDLFAVGVTHAVEGVTAAKIEPFLAAARKKVAAGLSDTHQDTHLALTQVAQVFDFFHDAIPAAERQAWIEWLNGHLAKYTADEGAFHNSTLSKIECYLQIAYATGGENPRANEFRDHAIRKLYEGRVLPVLREFGAGGGYTECGWYTRGSLWNLVKGLEMARRFEDYDGFGKAPRFFYQRLAYELLQPYPGLGEYRAEHYAVEGDGANTYGGHTEYPRHTRMVLAQYFRGSELARYVSAKRRPGSNAPSRLLDFLYEEEPEAPLELRSFPLAHAATGIGKVYARSDWTDQAAWLRFECGDFWNAHQHLEAGNFEIFARAPLATESGEYTDYIDSHSVNWLIRTVAHNCLLIHQPSESWPRMRDGGRNAYANDSGQAWKWEWPVQTLPQWQARRESFHRADLLAYDNSPARLFVAADCTRAYSPAKLAQWTRQIVFVRPGTFVVFDHVVSTKPEFTKSWLLHCRNEPAIRGNSFALTNGAGHLTVQTLLPEKPVLRKVQGYTYRGQTFEPRRSGLTPLACKWRVEVEPGEARAEDFFLHVLQTEQAQPARLVRQGDAVGAVVGETEVLFSGPVGGTLTVAGQSEVLAAGVKRGKYE